MLSPFCPYLAEDVYQNVIAPLTNKKMKESIHMEDWLKVDEKIIDEKLEKEMNIVKQIVEASYAARHDAGIKLRWPVGNVVVVSEKKEVAEAVKSLNDVLKAMCNAKKVDAKMKEPEGEFAKAETPIGDVFVDTQMSGKLLDEALFREIVRKVQSMRKKAGLKVSDKITLTIDSDEKTNKFLKGIAKDLSKEVGAKKVVVGEAVSNEQRDELKFKSVEVKIGFDVE